MPGLLSLGTGGLREDSKMWQLLVDLQILGLGKRFPCFVAADWNDNSLLALGGDVVAARAEDGSFLPTRWPTSEGDANARWIDYILSNFEGDTGDSDVDVWLYKHKLSDHKAVCLRWTSCLHVVSYGNVRNISVRPYQKIRKADAEPQRLVANAWFGKDAPDPSNDPIEDDKMEVQSKGTSPTVPFSIQVAQTALDSTCDSQDLNGDNSKSPPKRRAKWARRRRRFR